MPMFDPKTLILIGSIIFIASLVNGLCGFGFALVAVPFLMMFLFPRTVIPLITLSSLALGTAILIEARRHVKWRKVASLMAPGIVGMLIGVWLLVNLGIGSLKLYIGIIITLFALASLLGLRKDFEKEGTTYVVAGFLAGLLVHTRPPHSPLLPEPEDGEGDFQGQPHRVPPLPLPRHDPNVHLEWLDNLGVHEGLLNLRASPPLGGGRDRALSSHRRGIIQEVLVLVPLAGGMSIIAGLGII